MMSGIDEIPWSTSAYIADTTHLSTIQHGAYCLILMAMWRHKGSLPNDDRVLANIVKMSIPKWRRIADEIRALMRVEEGRITQKRLRSDYELASKTSSRNALNGSAGGRAKALKSKDRTLATARVSPADRQPSQSGDSLPFLEVERSDSRIKKTSSRGTTLPGEWIPTLDDLAYGRNLGLTDGDVQTMGEDMKLWARANANRQVGRKADWTATFQGWMRRAAAAIRPRGGPPRGPSNGAAAAARRAMQELEDDIIEQGRQANGDHDHPHSRAIVPAQATRGR